MEPETRAEDTTGLLSEALRVGLVGAFAVAWWSGAARVARGADQVRRDRLLTVRWNNRLSLGLALPGVVYVAVVASSDVLSDGAAFAGLVLFGVVY